MQSKPIIYYDVYIVFNLMSSLIALHYLSLIILCQLAMLDFSWSQNYMNANDILLKKQQQDSEFSWYNIATMSEYLLCHALLKQIHLIHHLNETKKSLIKKHMPDMTTSSTMAAYC